MGSVIILGIGIAFAFILRQGITYEMQIAEIKILILCAILVFSCIVFLISLYITKTIVKPINSMLTNAKRVANGENVELVRVNSKKKKKRRSEIDDITNIISIMTGEMKQNLNDVRKQKREIEAILLHMTDGIIAFDKDGNIIEGEEQITKAHRKFEKIYYKEEPKVLDEVLDSIKEADLIIFSMGSLYTSILPNIICRQVKEALNKATAPIMYLCNAVTQPGETDGYTVGDHVELLNKYLDYKKINVVIASNTKIDKKIAEKYESKEQKDPVKLDYGKLDKIGVELIEEDLIIVEDNVLRHDSMKLSSLIFSYLMR